MAENEIPPYPPIEPTTFDVIILGTGLPQSLIAAAASSAGKTVLHLDPNPFYGSHFASLSFHDLSSFLRHSQTQEHAQTQTPTETHHDYLALHLSTRPLYSQIDISSYAPQELERHARKFNLDLSGPRALFCADKSVDLLLKSGASHYVEFRSVDASFVYGENGEFMSVPDSRAAIFKDRSLGLTEKNQLMRFFKLVQEHLAAGAETSGSRISEEDLNSPFVEFLTKMRLPPKIKSIILYAIVMVDYEQENASISKDLLTTKDGIDRLALYHSSIGRFPNAMGAFIYPMYGQGELPQAFCRRAAVKGCLYVLRMPTVSLLVDKDSRHYRGVRLASGQDVFSQRLVLDPSFAVSLPLTSSLSTLQENLENFSLRDVKGKVARAICITGSSLNADSSNLLVVYPPRSLGPEQVASIRVLQIGGSLAVCPSDMFVLYISTLCTDASQGKNMLEAAINSLLTHAGPVNTESGSTIEHESTGVKPTLLWRALYVQELTVGQYDSICFTPIPDGNLNYNDILDATIELLQKIYPNEDFFPETPPENSEDDGGLGLESD